MQDRLGKTCRCAAAVALLVTLGACGGGDGLSQEDVDRSVAEALASQSAPSIPSAPPSPAVPQTAQSTGPPSVVAPETAKSPVPVVVDFKMPDFRGENLQVAQDRVQSLGVFFSVSHDVIAARSQVLDSNWKVCDQAPAPGASIKGNAADFEGEFDFGVVKLEEKCP